MPANDEHTPAYLYDPPPRRFIYCIFIWYVFRFTLRFINVINRHWLIGQVNKGANLPVA